MRYAGFWPRLGSLLLDLVVMSPLIVLSFWGTSQFRMFQVYYFLPAILFGLFYSVYLVRRFGGTPGKLIVGIRIRKPDGEPIGYREAFLRFLPDFILGTLMSIAFIIAVFHMTDAEYKSLAFLDRTKRILELVPSWYSPLHWIQTAWVWGELIVLLTNRKRRALHDFIAGTVVVHASPRVLPPVADTAVSV
ncbi:MAG: RDD family protein [Planctomycetota bacterium]|nr:RDD family protein [Planctomycetota bacterium]